MTPPPARRPLDVAALRAAEVADPVGSGTRGYASVEVVDEVGSTNAELLARARAGAADRTVLIAEHQTAGRGRLGRPWSAPRHAQLPLSVLLRPGPVPPVLLGWLPLVTGLAVRDALVGAGVDAALKWPNDVLVDGAKIAGILVEATSVPAAGDFGVRMPALVVGVGVNVDLTVDELPVPHATSVALVGGDADRDRLAAGLLRALDRRHGQWRDCCRGSGSAASPELAADYRAACSTLGRPIRADLPGGEELRGTAVDVDPEGRLVVETPAGVRTVAAGDVSHVRPTDGRG